MSEALRAWAELSRMLGSLGRSYRRRGIPLRPVPIAIMTPLVADLPPVFVDRIDGPTVEHDVRDLAAMAIIEGWR